MVFNSWCTICKVLTTNHIITTSLPLFIASCHSFKKFFSMVSFFKVLFDTRKHNIQSKWWFTSTVIFQESCMYFKWCLFEILKLLAVVKTVNNSTTAGPITKYLTFLFDSVNFFYPLLFTFILQNFACKWMAMFASLLWFAKTLVLTPSI